MSDEEASIRLGGVHVVQIMDPDGTISLTVDYDDNIHPWEVVGMLRVALQWELDGYPLPEEDEDD